MTKHVKKFCCFFFFWSFLLSRIDIHMHCPVPLKFKICLKSYNALVYCIGVFLSGYFRSNSVCCVNNLGMCYRSYGSYSGFYEVKMNSKIHSCWAGRKFSVPF